MALRTLVFTIAVASALLAIACGGADRRNAAIVSDSAAILAKQGRNPAAPRNLDSTCEPTVGVTCFNAVAIGHDIPQDPGWIIDAHWLVFATTNDSIEISAVPDSTSPVTSVAVSTNYGQDRDSLDNTASIKRLRMARDGLISTWVTMESIGSDTVGYTFKVRIVDRAVARVHPTGAVALLTIESSRPHGRFTIKPSSAPTSSGDSSWVVAPGKYHVALSADSLYEICSLPCAVPDTVLLKPGSKLTRRY